MSACPPQLEDTPCGLGIEGAFHTNPDGSEGGFVAGGAKAAKTVCVAKTAAVCSRAAVEGWARVYGEARVYGDSAEGITTKGCSGKYITGQVQDQPSCY